MVSETFENLNIEKKKRIFRAMLNEFEKYPLSQAQVARIINEVGISRGSFYKYFNGINDAYWYVYRIAMEEIHKQNVSRQGQKIPYQMLVRNFVEQTANSQFFNFIKMHLCVNESLIKNEEKQVFEEQPADFEEWAVMVLSHEVIKQILLKPTDKEKLLNYLDMAVKKIKQED
ncbi:TetR/AcrR family transcriptional regulator [Liquorilactobacillus mali]|uniref:Transcriptional regulator n=1 Tax=Liquorilactobacillus mali KCTC 3596 = DSM 20444 TaxID=1046596 RepID=J1F442_9LACO|nr:TetR/AcrR family transcriptional regulator [Liquorilactobacillus mali]EJF00570.1 transcriptional regulator [Liquorilactobacillus mali KCTC 3596 = DSM 20444]KRN10183.1 transcriptional regulator [Liquorilactobacillus mali KCTC 3596 = DSM 20444]MDC7953055.1 TetR/AcrR family transcriptional regulator [Liquorilactobacillus mali]MDV7757868.1 TetR family transcriptional regulator [Liquorilactobacillus mali]QFQ74055.1 TetR/AcrR family transcriptional regulator [Liquorilactobacillus mali]